MKVIENAGMVETLSPIANPVTASPIASTVPAAEPARQFRLLQIFTRAFGGDR
jgi:spore maturation protein SpmA